MLPNPPKAEFQVDETADFKGKIPEDVTRPIEKQDTSIHVSGGIDHKGLEITGAHVEISGTL